ncbi:unnamed protein product [Lactuca virosa]|uniref:Disease resistance protein At4g27190-like leucine-rich repeats domain-containing protein n=1 Tax=Lactuca virosa TaxID=75947 RepID=A0AAU9N8Y6_9ASTR|nr:unnamed protein product [Lactuca virosa]
MVKLLSNLKKVQIEGCYGIEELVSNRDDRDEEHTTSTSTHTSTYLFPLLDSLILDGLKSLKYIGGGGAKGRNNEIYFSSTTTIFSRGWCFLELMPIAQYPRKISICCCYALSSVIPCYVAGQTQKLHVLKITLCNGMKEVFETQGVNKSVIMLKLTNLKILNINSCALLEHIFKISTLESLVQLEELRIKNCKAMKVIVVKAEEPGVEKTKNASSSKAVVKFPRLKCIELFNLRELVGFFLGTNHEFQWPSLEKVVIYDCPEMKVFTAGGSTAPQLKYVETNLGKYSPPGSWFNTTPGQHQEISCPGVGSRSSSCSAPNTSEESNIWSFHNLIELHVKSNDDVKKIIPSSELLQLQKLDRNAKEIISRVHLASPICNQPATASANDIASAIAVGSKALQLLQSRRRNILLPPTACPTCKPPTTTSIASVSCRRHQRQRFQLFFTQVLDKNLQPKGLVMSSHQGRLMTSHGFPPTWITSDGRNNGNRRIKQKVLEAYQLIGSQPEHWVNEKSWTVFDKYEKAMCEKYGPDPSQHPLGDVEIWEHCVDGRKKGRVYGVGSSDPGNVVSGTSYECGSSSHDYALYQKKINELESMLEREVKKREEIEANFDIHRKIKRCGIHEKEFSIGC